MENFSEAFLAKVATRILHNHPGVMHHACVVLPNRRAGIFLKRHMSASLEKPAFAPAIFSIEDFVFEISGLNQADQLVLLWELYECYAGINGPNAHSFEEFLKWAGALLQDFEDVDMHLADANALFSYLSEAKAIELWNPGKTFLTAGQQKYLEFYRSLAELYSVFTSHLVQQKKAYKGLAFRYLAENIEDKQPGLRWEHLYFAGFNAITPAEKKIMEAFAARMPLTRLFDADNYYLDNPKQEAGKYLRRIAGEIKSGGIEWVNNKLANGSKNIQVIGVPHNTGQVLVAGELLAGLNPAESGNTAVVLNDESLLIPLLNAMPDNITHFNVTMGYPFSLTPVYGLMEVLLNLQLHAIEKARGVNAGSITQVRFYFRNVAGLLKHPYIQDFLQKQQIVADDSVAALLGEGKVFYSKDEIFKHFSKAPAALSLLKLFFENWHSAIQAIDNLKEINKMLATYMAADNEKDRNKMNLEYLFQFSLILNRMKLLAKRAGEELGLRSLHQLLRNVASSTQLPFVGEPLTGVQIMGMLETRALDFKNIIMLSVNEGVLPAGKHLGSFVPFDIRREFGLPVYSDRDAVFAYHFFRLLQRCENMYLVYNTTPDDLGGGEKSRFILQIEHELSRINQNIRYKEQFYTPPVSFDPAVKEILIEKTPDILSGLEEMAKYGFSPTALSTYVSCPLLFYFTYVLKIREENITEDSMDALTFGSGIHGALEELYKPFLNQTLTSAILDKISAEANPALYRNFLKAYNNNDLDYGRNHLMVKVAESFLRRFIADEKKQIEALQREGKQLTVEAVEHEFGRRQPIKISVEISEDKTISVTLRGLADRIDRFGDTLRIIDYKTGDVKSKDLKLAEWDELLSSPDKGKSLQLLIYAYLYAREHDVPLPGSGIISFRNLKNGFMSVSVPGEENAAIQEIEKILRTILREIFDASIPFRQTEKPETCRYCMFAGVCGR